MQKAFAEHPELAKVFGDMVAHAQESILTVATGHSLTTNEAIACQAADSCKRLAATATSELEKLLVNRVVSCWIRMEFAPLAQ